jgi:hypothetical protein
MFALFAAIVGISSVVWISTSDFTAELAVKADTARLRATLQSIIYKAAQQSSRPIRDTFQAEREAVTAFALSTSAWGYRKWVDRRRKPAASGAPDPWDSFFLKIASLMLACEPPTDRSSLKLARESAIWLDELLLTLKRRDINSISAFARDLAGEIQTPAAVAIAALSPRTSEIGADFAAAPRRPEALPASGVEPEPVPVALPRDGRRPGDKRVRVRRALDLGDPRANAARARFLFLKDGGIRDPNIDMFIAVLEKDAEGLTKALAAGADPSVTDAQVLAAYSAELAAFGTE